MLYFVIIVVTFNNMITALCKIISLTFLTCLISELVVFVSDIFLLVWSHEPCSINMCSWLQTIFSPFLLRQIDTNTCSLKNNLKSVQHSLEWYSLTHNRTCSVGTFINGHPVVVYTWAFSKGVLLIHISLYLISNVCICTILFHTSRNGWNLGFGGLNFCEKNSKNCIRYTVLLKCTFRN